MKAFITITLALIVAFGGVGATAYAAQDSLPSDTLYPVKLAAEDVQLALNQDPQVEIDLLMDYAAERTAEIAALAQAGASIPAGVTDRLEKQLDQALVEAAKLDDLAMTQALNQVVEAADQQIAILDAVAQDTSGGSGETVQNTIQTIMRRRGQAQDGTTDPASYRLRLGHGRPAEKPEQPDNQPGSGGAGDSQGQGSGGGGQGQGSSGGAEQGQGSGSNGGQGQGSGGGSQGQGSGGGQGQGSGGGQGQGSGGGQGQGSGGGSGNGVGAGRGN